MRTGSGDRKIRAYDPPGGFRSDSPKNLRSDSSRFRSRESGRGWDGIGGEEEKFEERLSREFEFVRKVLPEEHPGFAVSALLSIRALGGKPTRDAIAARLEASGRTVRQLREKGWL